MSSSNTPNDYAERFDAMLETHPPKQVYNQWRSLISSYNLLGEKERAMRVAHCRNASPEYNAKYFPCHDRLCPFCCWVAGNALARKYAKRLRMCREPLLLTLRLPTGENWHWNDPAEQQIIVRKAWKSMVNRKYWKLNVMGYLCNIGVERTLGEWNVHIHAIIRFTDSDPGGMGFWGFWRMAVDMWEDALQWQGIVRGPNDEMSCHLTRLDPTNTRVIRYMCSPPHIQNNAHFVHQYLDAFTNKKLIIPSGSFRKQPYHVPPQYYRHVKQPIRRPWKVWFHAKPIRIVATRQQKRE